MISPHTPPGALIVCVEDDVRHRWLPPLKNGAVYVLAAIVEGVSASSGIDGPTRFAVELEGFDHSEIKIENGFFGTPAYPIEVFELAVLPKALRELTTKAPDPALLKEAEHADA